MSYKLSVLSLAAILSLAFVFVLPATHTQGEQTEREVGGTPPPPGGGDGTTGGGGGATGSTTQTIGIKNPLGAENMTIAELLDKIANFLLIISVPIAAIMVVIGGYQIIVFSSNPEKIKTGKNTILYAAVGFAIVLLAKGVTVVIKEVLGASQSGGSPPAATSSPPTGQTGGERGERELIQ